MITLERAATSSFNLRWFAGAAAAGLIAPVAGYLAGSDHVSYRQYGVTWPEEWTRVVVSVAIHLAVLAVLIIPWRSAERFRRIQFIVGGVLFTLLGLFELTVTHHAGSVVRWHTLWVLGVGIAAAVTALLRSRG